MSIKFSYQHRIAIHLLLAFGLRCGQPALAQDANFAQPYAAPLYLNPAYSGMEDAMRMGATYQYKLGRLDNPYMLYAVYADYYFNAFKSGAGICAVSDRQGGGALTNTSVGASYAYNLRIAEETFLRFGLQALLDVISTNAAKLVFPDMLGAYGSAAIADNAYASEQKTYFDMAVGSVFSHRIFYVGAALHNLMQAPSGEVLGQPVTTPRKITLHGGCNVSVPLYGRRTANYRGSTSTLTFSPNAVYGWQGSFHSLALGGYVGLNNFSGGFFYKAGFDANSKVGFYSASVAYSSGWLSVIYSFDFGKMNNMLRKYSPNIHEISLIFRIKRQVQRSYYFQNRNSDRKTQNMPYFNYL
ncbi:MAG: PorP/SprF family type IX secretion system membrane protein [Prevotellaceae bacterium]|jgi:type IX secretion system PorP/SprF family membrane protein|nr:PorP/SprF family type IX secretion system membrane protein [Prevotellaceae bacterium]